MRLTVPMAPERTTELERLRAENVELRRQLLDHATTHDRAEASLREIADALPVFIARLDENAHYEFQNRHYADSFGISLQQTKGKHIAEVLGPKAWEGIRDRVDTVLAGGIAHDFNNLLVGILGVSSLGLVKCKPEGEIRNILEQINSAGERAAELCQQLLAYSGRGQFRIGTLDLTELTSDSLNLLTSLLPKSVQVDTHLGFQLPPILGDAPQIRQVLMNLVTNAAEAIDGHGTIRVETGRRECDRGFLDACTSDEGTSLPEGDYVYLEVADSGCGMDEDTITRIFDPFFTTKFTGRGLGLAAVLGIVGAHRAALQVRSRPGDGSRFRLFFPDASAEIEADVQAAHALAFSSKPE